MKVVRIFPKTNFHTYLHSDTLWGNLIYAYRMLYGVEETSKLLKRFLSGDIPYKVSSIFPFEKLDNNKFVYYLPKPLTNVMLQNARNPEEMAYLKEFKDIKYIEKDIFEKFISGELNDNLLFERFYNWKNEKDKLENNQWKNNEQKNNEQEQIIKKKEFRFLKRFKPFFNLHNSIDRMKGSTLQAEGRGQLYWEEEFPTFGNYLTIHKEQTTGMYFLVEGKNEDLILAPLRLLSHIGIGGNKSIGKGSFVFEVDDFSFSEIENHNSYVSLSLFKPNNDEIKMIKNLGNNIFYDISTRIGKVGRDFNVQAQHKNPVICFTEGSTFFTKEQLKGQIVPTAKYDEQNEIYSNYIFFGVKANLRLQ